MGGKMKNNLKKCKKEGNCLVRGLDSNPYPP